MWAISTGRHDQDDRCRNRHTSRIQEDGGLSDFLDNRLAPADPPGVVGAKLLEYFCLHDTGGFNGFMPGVKLAVAFLDETLNAPSDAKQRGQSLKDLESTLARAKDRKQIDLRVDAWYR